jgi:hypothetical protein
MRSFKQFAHPVILLIVATFLASARADESKVEGTQKGLAKAEKHRANIDEFFSHAGPVAALSFEFAPEELDKLRKDPRQYAKATMTEAGGKTYRGVGVKLKGGRSFRGIDDQPGLTVNLKKYPGGERFHGMEKFHLNNAVQDATFLQEIIAAEMCRAAGVPAGRGTHALVRIAGRDRGLYVLKEAYTEDFLVHFFADPRGDLYDGGSWAELSEKMEKDQGDDAERNNIKELIAACREPDPARRWARVDAILDADAYVTFTALEAITAQTDGYNFNHNNYRVYFDPATGKAHFIHHGMDQTFVSTKFGLLRASASLAWVAVFSNPAWQGRYRERLQSVHANALAPVDWAERIGQIGAKVEAALTKAGSPMAAEFPAKVAQAQKRVRERLANVAAQLEKPPQPVEFDAGGTLALDGLWQPMKWSGRDLKLDQTPLDGVVRLHFRAESAANGAWLREVLLPAGRYRLEGRARGAGVSFRARTKMLGQQALTGDGEWQTGSCDFETPEAEVTLYVEYKSGGGEAWVDRESLRLVRLK